ncbi:MAG: type II toxin-antitoxin system RelE/ParE family toxin [Deltaproteobacteria bacterium]|nr:type II toxin-antitoxin system RelE/ParE family toxin [Deltaproteobacteria bacterium]
MICSFVCKHTEKLFHGGRVLRFHAFTQQAEKRLQVLDSATCIDDLMNLPSNRFEALAGDRKGQHSIRINQQWRICFEWHEDGQHNVEIVDYH